MSPRPARPLPGLEVDGTPRDQPAGAGAVPGFAVHLDVFEGPFDLLLGLIAKHRLDITEVALSQVTDEFIAYIRGRGPDWDLDTTTSFLVVASTLLDLKTARLLPAGEVEDEDDLAVLEARDLLFARLLQYRAFKEVAASFAVRMAAESLLFPRAVGMEAQFTALLPEVVLGIGPERLAELAARAMAPKPAPAQVSLVHLHQPQVSVREQGIIVIERLRRVGNASFRSLTHDCPSLDYVVARFLALLELYREKAVAFDQLTPLGDLNVRWTGDDQDVIVSDEFDTDEFDAPTPEGSVDEETS